MLGKQMDRNRELLLYTDFAVTRDVLNFKSSGPKGRTKTKTIEKLYDMPLVGFLRAMLITLSECDEDILHDLEYVVFDFVEAGLINAIDPTENANDNEQLSRKWESICHLIGGVLDFIAARNWSKDDRDLKISCEPWDFFTPTSAIDQVESQRVKAIGSNQQLNKVLFSVKLLDSQRENSFEKEFEWRFVDDVPWLPMFDDISSKPK